MLGANRPNTRFVAKRTSNGNSNTTESYGIAITIVLQLILIIIHPLMIRCYWRNTY